jgi:excisionase family DNA binding protein
MHKRVNVSTTDGVISLSSRLLTVQQVAGALQVGRSTVYDLINEDGLPHIKVKGAIRVPLASLEWWIAQRECSSLDFVNDYLKEKASKMTENTLGPVALDKRRRPSKKGV